MNIEVKEMALAAAIRRPQARCWDRCFSNNDGGPAAFPANTVVCEPDLFHAHGAAEVVKVPMRFLGGAR